ncbi:unnamed protein product [Tuber melanosporum]|uniref:(Perigord truffle) hypothetical protein n=1 Tax=Tuber melanosporum (strain Mel28) TaxID=656061 RepID=D5GEW9_TUBMM|nr:uncharacterized protein GSTUM_00006626001 [Tuber melanosporum]CAZ83062.1 unnamed protein product [Tuber melanosporum]
MRVSYTAYRMMNDTENFKHSHCQGCCDSMGITGAIKLGSNLLRNWVFSQQGCSVPIASPPSISGGPKRKVRVQYSYGRC